MLISVWILFVLLHSWFCVSSDLLLPVFIVTFSTLFSTFCSRSQAIHLFSASMIPYDQVPLYDLLFL